MHYTGKWYVMAAAAMGMFLGTIDGSIVNIALPILEEQLHTQFAVVQWVVLGYLLTITTLMLAVGRLADMIGKKRLYLAGFIIFTLGSGLCGLATTIVQLIGFRVLQAVGASMITALGTAIVTEAFPAEERGMALGVSGLMISIGLISGPTMGGLILGSLPWNWIFFVNLPVGALGTLLVIRFVPQTRPTGRERFDILGAASMFASLLSFLVALTVGQNEGFGSPVVIGLLGIFAASLVLFVTIEKRTPEPMIDFSLFRNRRFTLNLVTGFLTFISGAGAVLLMPFFLENVLQYDPQRAGILLSTVPLSMGIVAPISGVLSDRFGPRRLTLAGLIALTLGYLAVSTLDENVTMLGYMLRFIPVGIGLGLFQSPNNSEIMGAAPLHRLGVASSLLSVTRTVAQTSGISIMGALWAGSIMAALGPAFTGDATSAPIHVQVVATQHTILVIVAILSLAVGLSIWGYWSEKKGERNEPVY
ncbi:MAG: DHA2 family efflux MFS transporter permease subunit [Chloroflexi bacterium]|nr:DHA2 family efflux MFS transporter permease subunit [Chloroflexota bacterium]